MSFYRIEKVSDEWMVTRVGRTTSSYDERMPFVCPCHVTQFSPKDRKDTIETRGAELAVREWLIKNCKKPKINGMDFDPKVGEFKEDFSVICED